jgi:hypothetical protein
MFVRRRLKSFALEGSEISSYPPRSASSAPPGIQAVVGWKPQNLDSRFRGNDDQQKVDFDTFQILGLVGVHY